MPDAGAMFEFGSRRPETRVPRLLRQSTITLISMIYLAFSISIQHFHSASPSLRQSTFSNQNSAIPCLPVNQPPTINNQQSKFSISLSHSCHRSAAARSYRPRIDYEKMAVYHVISPRLSFEIFSGQQTPGEKAPSGGSRGTPLFVGFDVAFWSIARNSSRLRKLPEFGFGT